MPTLAAFLVALLAGALGLVGYSALGTYRAEREYPAMGKFVQVDGVRLHYTDQGEGPSIVLIHGASTTLRDFDNSILQPLATDHRVIAVDRPGYGYSERPEGSWPDPSRQARLIRGVLDRLGIDEPVLVGHSWSGSVVLAYLLAYPNKAAGGVLLAGASHPWKGGVAWYHHLAGVPVIGPLFARTLLYPVGQLFLGDAIQGVFKPNPVPPQYEQRTGVILTLRPKSFLANAQDVRELSDFLSDQSRHYETIQKSLLLITGDSDTVVPPWNHAERLIKQVTHAELIVLANTGHALHHTQPEYVAKLIHGLAQRVSNVEVGHR